MGVDHCVYLSFVQQGGDACDANRTRISRRAECNLQASLRMQCCAKPAKRSITSAIAFTAPDFPVTPLQPPPSLLVLSSLARYIHPFLLDRYCEKLDDVCIEEQTEEGDG